MNEPNGITNLKMARDEDRQFGVHGMSWGAKQSGVRVSQKTLLKWRTSQGKMRNVRYKFHAICRSFLSLELFSPLSFPSTHPEYEGSSLQPMLMKHVVVLLVLLSCTSDNTGLLCALRKKCMKRKHIGEFGHVCLSECCI